MLKKTTMCVSLMLCLVFAGTATATPVVYDLTADGGVLGGTITLDLDFDPDESDSGEDVYLFGNPAIVDFSLWQANTLPALFEPTDSVWDFEVMMSTADDTPLGLFVDVDNDPDGTGSLYGGLDFNVASQTFDTQGTVTNAALTPVPEPATMSLLALGGIALIRRRRRV